MKPNLSLEFTNHLLPFFLHARLGNQRSETLSTHKCKWSQWKHAWIDPCYIVLAAARVVFISPKTFIYTLPISSEGRRTGLCLSRCAQSLGTREAPTDRRGSAEFQDKERRWRQPHRWVCLCWWAEPSPRSFKGGTGNWSWPEIFHMSLPCV